MAKDDGRRSGHLSGKTDIEAIDVVAIFTGGDLCLPQNTGYVIAEPIWLERAQAMRIAPPMISGEQVRDFNGGTRCW